MSVSKKTVMPNRPSYLLKDEQASVPVSPIHPSQARSANLKKADPSFFLEEGFPPPFSVTFWPIRPQIDPLYGQLFGTIYGLWMKPEFETSYSCS